MLILRYYGSIERNSMLFKYVLHETGTIKTGRRCSTPYIFDTDIFLCSGDQISSEAILRRTDVVATAFKLTEVPVVLPPRKNNGDFLLALFS